ncbi:hypothetical protein F383_24328 [Gossypium arboreum]|uniref:Uncharacterized protein n=1 Tax=Gossypium arboreum TaxID=29729 RepID=A0A0B0NY58_GOSAR|nr:hypothetical protein F383_24328 [Gossypium arboreum]
MLSWEISAKQGKRQRQRELARKLRLS